MTCALPCLPVQANISPFSFVRVQNNALEFIWFSGKGHGANKIKAKASSSRVKEFRTENTGEEIRPSDSHAPAM